MPMPDLLDSELDQERTLSFARGCEHVGKGFKRIDRCRLDAHAAGQLHPVEVGACQVEQFGRYFAGLGSHIYPGKAVTERKY